MSATICPSCLSRSFEAGRCGKCGFTAAEYKCPRTALPLGTIMGAYRVGVMKSNSRQSQIYTAAHTETSAPVIIEEFFPAKVVGRRPETAEVSLVSDDEELAQRFQQGCLLVEASTQKRPLKRLETFRANNTVYSVFEPVNTKPVAAQCEAMADYPYYFRDQNGMPMMSINLLTIPPMPALRDYNPEQYKKLAPITQPSDESDSFSERLITENAGSGSRKKLIGILAGVAAVLVAAIAILFITDPLGWRRKPEETTPPVEAQVTDDLEAEKRKQEEEARAAAEKYVEPLDEVLAALKDKDSLNKDEFLKLLRINSADGTPVTGQSIDMDGEDPKMTGSMGNVPVPIDNERARLVDREGRILREHKELKETETPESVVQSTFYYVVKQEGNLYLVEAGTAETNPSGGEESTALLTSNEEPPVYSGKNRLAFVLWKDQDNGPKAGTVMEITSAGEGKDDWIGRLKDIDLRDTDISVGIWNDGDTAHTFSSDILQTDNTYALVVTPKEGDAIKLPLRETNENIIKPAEPVQTGEDTAAEPPSSEQNGSSGPEGTSGEKEKTPPADEPGETKEDGSPDGTEEAGPGDGSGVAGAEDKSAPKQPTTGEPAGGTPKENPEIDNAAIVTKPDNIDPKPGTPEGEQPDIENVTESTSKEAGENADTANSQTGAKITREELLSHLSLISTDNSKNTLTGMLITENSSTHIWTGISKEVDKEIQSPAEVQMITTVGDRNVLLVSSKMENGRIDVTEAAVTQNKVYYYAIVSNKGKYYKVKIGKNNPVGGKSPEYELPDQGEKTKLVVTLWDKVGEWEAGTRMCFDSGDDKEWFEDMLIKSPTLNEVMNWDNTKYSIEIENDKPVLKVWMGETPTPGQFALKPLPDEEKKDDDTSEFKGGALTAETNQHDTDKKDLETEDNQTKPDAVESSEIIPGQRDDLEFRLKVKYGDRYIFTKENVSSVTIKREVATGWTKVELQRLGSDDFTYRRRWGRPDGREIYYEAGTYSVEYYLDSNTDPVTETLNYQPKD